MIVFFDKWKIFSEFLKVKYIYLKNHTTIVTSCNSKVKYNNINYNNFNFDGIIKVTTCNITCKQETKVCWEIIEAHPSPKQECVGGTAVRAGGCAVYILGVSLSKQGGFGPSLHFNKCLYTESIINGPKWWCLRFKFMFRFLNKNKS